MEALSNPCRCKKNEATEKYHPCPYQSDVNNDPDPEYCNCCDECEFQCAQDI